MTHVSARTAIRVPANPPRSFMSPWYAGRSSFRAPRGARARRAR
jgi:hypothetical protein